VAPPFDQIEPRLHRLRAFVLNDLEGVVGREVGGNYAATALVVSAYDALGDLSKKEGWVLFGERLPAPWRPVAKSLYEALRNGLVHHYDPKVIVVDGRRIELCISWRERPHLSLQGARVYLNVQQMAVDLRGTFEDYEAVLRHDAALRDRFWRRAGTGEVHVYSPQEAQAWRELLGPPTVGAS